MNKKVLILSGSPRESGNSDLLCDELMRGAIESKNNVEKICIGEKNIGFCVACYYCKENNGKCIKKDDMAEILDKIIKADVIVMASPVYFYSLSAQMKALIDRTVARWTEIKNKDFYYIATAAEEGEEIMQRTIECFRGFADCFEGSNEMGIIYGDGVYKKGEILKSSAMIKAYEMGLLIK